MGALALWLKSKFMGNSVTWIFLGVFLLVIGIIVLPNLEQIKERLGFETRTSLKLQVQEQAKTIDNIVAANEDLKQNNIVEDSIKNIVERQKEEQANALEEAHKKVEHTVTTKKSKIRAIKKAYQANAPNVDKAKAKAAEAKEISKVQIGAIWTTYCQYNANPACQASGDTQ